MLSNAGVVPASMSPVTVAPSKAAPPAAPSRRLTRKATRTIAIDLGTARTASGVGANAPLVIDFEGSFIHSSDVVAETFAGKMTFKAN